MWYVEDRRNQAIADGAAVTRTVALSRDSGLSPDDLETVVRGAAAGNGLAHGAVGGIPTFGEPCLVALDETADRAIELIGTADVAPARGIASNSNSDEAIYIGGNATVTHAAPSQPLPARVANPYAGLFSVLQADPACIGTNQPQRLKASDPPVSPGPFCGGSRIPRGRRQRRREA